MSLESHGIQFCPVAMGNTRGIVSLWVPLGHCFSKADWVEMLGAKNVHDKTEVTLKRDGANSVVVKTLEIGGRSIKAVVKTHSSTRLIDQIIDLLRPAKSVVAFKVATHLQGIGVAAEFPLAALRKRTGLLKSQSVYITSYVPQSMNLSEYARKEGRGCPFSERKEIARQVAAILAQLHHKRLRHRDAKASNFLIAHGQQGRPELMLVDMDGIKPYRYFGINADRYHAFVNLGAALLAHKDVYKTDYLRAFKIYCKLTGLNVEECRRRFKEIATAAAVKRMKKDKIAQTRR